MWGVLLDSILLSSFSIDWLQIGQYILVFLLSTIKFWVSILWALGLNYNWVEVFFCCTVGSFVGVYAFTYFGKEIRKWIDSKFTREKTKNKNFGRKRRIIKFWKKYGLWGTSFISPFISPPASVIIALSFREKPIRILRAMLVSLVFWTIVFVSFKNIMISLAGIFG